MPNFFSVQLDLSSSLKYFIPSYDILLLPKQININKHQSLNK